MRHIKPMLATLVDKPFDAKGWLFEVKWDGFRAIAEIYKNKVELYSRNLLLFNEHFPQIVKTLSKLKKDMVLDGEVVVLDKHGKSHFQLLQNYLPAKRKLIRQAGLQNKEGQLIYYVFDILFLGTKDLRKLPLLERKKILNQTLPKLTNVKISDDIADEGIAFFKIARKQGLEGIVAKNADSEYKSGIRSRDWLKIKIHQQQEAVIAGFTEPRGSRKKFGALVLGVYKRGKLIYIGHTGGGFDEASLKLVYDKLQKLKQKNSPFEIIPKTNAPVTWVKPKLVCEVSFAEWTGDDHMRQPIFLGLRPDKKPAEVRRELPSN
jgi:bifunctional non-homologous end joining protein LigD